MHQKKKQKKQLNPKTRKGTKIMKYKVVLFQMSEDCREILNTMVAYEGNNKSIARTIEYRCNGGNINTYKGFRYSFAEFRENA